MKHLIRLKVNEFCLKNILNLFESQIPQTLLSCAFFFVCPRDTLCSLILFRYKYVQAYANNIKFYSYIKQWVVLRIDGPIKTIDLKLLIFLSFSDCYNFGCTEHFSFLRVVAFFFSGLEYVQLLCKILSIFRPGLE